MRESTLDALAALCDDMVRVTTYVREDTKEAVATDDHVEVIRHYNHLRITMEKLKEARAALTEMEQRLSYEQVPEVMRSHNIRTTTIEGVGRVSLSNRWSCSMLDKQLGLDWLRNEGHEGLIQETVNSSTLAAFAKSMSLDSGFDLPPDIFKTSIMTITSITKAGVV